MSGPVRVGTRGSALALAQAEMVAKRLAKAGHSAEVVVIQTQGDLDKQTPLSEMGGKGVFIKALEAALISGEIDLAVHSFKDITSSMPDSLRLSGFFAPESILDVAVMADGLGWDALPKGARIGTGSLRRKAIINRYWPHLEVVPIRGNVASRLEKMDILQLSAVILSEVGLLRLGLTPGNVHRFNPSQFLPAPGQGVIALQTRQSDEFHHDLSLKLSDSRQVPLSHLDYQILSELAFNCQIPLGVRTAALGDKFALQATVFSEDLSRHQEFSYEVAFSDAETTVSQFVAACRAFFEGAS